MKKNVTDVVRVPKLVEECNRHGKAAKQHFCEMIIVMVWRLSANLPDKVQFPLWKASA